MPGLFDNADDSHHNYKNNDMPPSIKHLVNL